MRLPRIWGTHSHYYSNFVGPGDDPAVPSENGVKSLVKYFVNNQGGDLEGGDVVKYDPSGDNFVVKTTITDDIDALGVVISGTYVNGDSVPVCIEGYHPSVAVTGTVNRGDYLFAHATDGVAYANAIPSAGAFGRVVADDVGGFAAAIIFDVVFGTGNPRFTDLIDVPSAYTGAAGKATVVNGTEDGLEFVDFPLPALTTYRQFVFTGDNPFVFVTDSNGQPVFALLELE